MTHPLVSLEAINAGYGAAQVLFDMSLSVNRGEVVSLLGRNGMGKTTTIRTMFGLLKVRSGRLHVGGKDMTGAPPHQIATHGLGYVPEGRRIFPRLSVEENIIATARKGGAWPLARLYDLFPRLAERRNHRGTQLSGGEQQMLAISRALATGPELLVLDEATEGLAPVIRSEIWKTIRLLKQEGLSILIIDKNIDALMTLADRHVVIEKGRVVWSGDSQALSRDRSLATSYLEL